VPEFICRQVDCKSNAGKSTMQNCHQLASAGQNARLEMQDKNCRDGKDRTDLALIKMLYVSRL